MVGMREESCFPGLNCLAAPPCLQYTTKETRAAQRFLLSAFRKASVSHGKKRARETKKWREAAAIDICMTTPVELAC
jgi:hypothetical protein